MKRILYILLSLLCFTACQNDEELPARMAELSLSLEQAGRPVVSTRASSANIAIVIKNSEGAVVKEYAAGVSPESKIVLAEGSYTIIAYTDNQDSWQTDNDGKGAPCYYGEANATLVADEITYVTLNMPAKNYAVSLSLPERFNELFNAYTLTLTNGSRIVSIAEGEKAYFRAEDKGFSYAFSATNIDGATHSASPIDNNEVENGKLYNLKFIYGSPTSGGGIDIEIKDDMEEENGYIDLSLTRGVATRATTSTITQEEAGNFLVSIYKGSEPYRSTVLLKNLEKNLPAGGGYSIKAENCDEQTAITANDGWGQKRYAGISGQFRIESGRTTKVSISCSVVNSGLTFTFDESVKSLGSYSMTVTDGNRQIVFDSTTDGKIAYFNVPAEGTKDVTYHLVAGGIDKEGTLALSMAKLKNLTIANPTEGSLDLSITYDDTMDIVEKEILIEE